MNFSPNFWTTTVGSFPHREAPVLCERLIRSMNVPAWPQLPKRIFYENMYIQFSQTLPSIRLDVSAEKISFDTNDNLIAGVETFYERYLADDVDAFALSPQYAAGFYTFVEALKAGDQGMDPPDVDSPAAWVKGQVTGPISIGLTVTDQHLRASLYHEFLADVLVKNAAMQARWQVRQLRKLRPYVIIAVDEPYMASFGSAYISLSREQVIAMLDEVFEAIHAEGALAWVHCCANTDWSVLLATQVDILNLDAYGYLQNLALYPLEVSAFLQRGGAIAWGIVPNTDEVFRFSAQDLAQRLLAGFDLIHNKASARGVEIPLSTLEASSLLTTSCGLGTASVEVADRSLETLKRMRNSFY